ncbi:hypothetical protein BKA62DRAFT_45734 [Auriculariales sp. MPI-PUGE-AT-0066]|nr:hypothetical protein BKA62DRAFT_45734 [Auriculariales sp. MPI-PUGE-AT-0066]
MDQFIDLDYASDAAITYYQVNGMEESPLSQIELDATSGAYQTDAIIHPFMPSEFLRDPPLLPDDDYTKACRIHGIKTSLHSAPDQCVAPHATWTLGSVFNPPLEWPELPSPPHHDPTPPPPLYPSSLTSSHSESSSASSTQASSTHAPSDWTSAASTPSLIASSSSSYTSIWNSSGSDYLSEALQLLTASMSSSSDTNASVSEPSEFLPEQAHVSAKTRYLPPPPPRVLETPLVKRRAPSSLARAAARPYPASASSDDDYEPGPSSNKDKGKARKVARPRVRPTVEPIALPVASVSTSGPGSAPASSSNDPLYYDALGTLMCKSLAHNLVSGYNWVPHKSFDQPVKHGETKAIFASQLVTAVLAAAPTGKEDPRPCPFISIGCRAISHQDHTLWKRHVKTHGPAESKPTCKWCGKSAARQDSLNRHMKKCPSALQAQREGSQSSS